jgi:hypothetical protein
VVARPGDAIRPEAASGDLGERRPRRDAFNQPHPTPGPRTIAGPKRARIELIPTVRPSTLPSGSQVARHGGTTPRDRRKLMRAAAGPTVTRQTALLHGGRQRRRVRADGCAPNSTTDDAPTRSVTAMPNGVSATARFMFRSDRSWATGGERVSLYRRSGRPFTCGWPLNRRRLRRRSRWRLQPRAA